MIPQIQRSGEVAVTDDRGMREYRSFVCAHCNRIIIVKPGSGRQRGFCLLCQRPTCGHAACGHCVPWEAKLEAMEGRRRFWKQLELTSAGMIRS